MRLSSKPLLAATAVLAALLAGLAASLGSDAVATFDAAAGTVAAGGRADTALAFFAALTLLGTGNLVAAACGLASIVLALQGRLRLAAGLWLGLAGAGATTYALKLLVARARPDFLAGHAAGSLSFPSSHVTAAMAGYALLAYVLTRRVRHPALRAACWSAAALAIALVACSRVVLGVHHASDVVGGLLVGGSWTLLGIAAAGGRGLETQPGREAQAVRQAAGGQGRLVA